jgi:GNAT superfamily N-acetyltransferase
MRFAMIISYIGTRVFANGACSGNGAMKLRLAGMADSEAISAVLTASYSRALVDDYDAPTLERAMPLLGSANPALLSSGSYYVVEADGEIAACGGWTREAPGTGKATKGAGHIRHFATHPDLLRQGAAGVILRQCIDEARQSGISRLFVQSTLTAQPFYEAYGFRRIRGSDLRLGEGVNLDTVTMRLDLDGA